MGTVYIQKLNGQLVGTEGRLIYQHCIVEKLKTQFFDSASLSGESNTFEDCSLIVGSVEALVCAFEVLSIPIPTADYYPLQLNEYLYRQVWMGSPADVLARMSHGMPVFAKSNAWKKLTGQVFDSGTGADLLAALPVDEKLWLSEPVSWLSEYRVYVTNHHITAVCFYTGDDTVLPDLKVIEKAVAIMEASGAPDAYAIDWGVLSDGATALVEMGDGWAMGAYKGISPRQYFDFLTARWIQLLTLRTTPMAS